MKLNAYMEMENEFEELKEKVKYEGGKFLNNERKDNEIIILRQENSILKKEIEKYKENNKLYESKLKTEQELKQDLKSQISLLNKKISKLEKEKEKINHSIIQRISNKFNNLNKIIEIPNKQSIISCDKENIKKFKKDFNNNYLQVNYTKIDTEIKCIEYINDDVFVSVMPANDEIVFYDVNAMHSNKYVVGMAFNKTCVSDSYESCLCLQFFYILTAAITHTRAKTAHHLEYCIGKRSLERNSTFNSLGNKLFVVLLEISVLTAHIHSGDTAHSAIDLELSALIDFGVSG
jgi:hypothetical protein